MKTVFALTMLVAAVSTADARGYGTGSSSRSSGVHSYVTPRGTYVAPHHRTTPDSTRLNNYGTNPNYNPWNGKTGTKSGL